MLGRGRAACSLTPNDQSGIIRCEGARCEGVFSALGIEQGKPVRPSALLGIHARLLRFAVGNTVQQAALNVHNGVAEKSIDIAKLARTFTRVSGRTGCGLVMAYFDLRFISSLEERSISKVKSDG